MHGHSGPFNTVTGQGDVGDPRGQGLDQVDGVRLDRLLDAVDENTVMLGVGEVVTGCRRTGVDAQRQVDDEDLALAPPEVEDAG